MSPLVWRSIVKELLIVVSCTLPVCVLSTLALGQHSSAHTAGGAVHISSPPISHAPISSAPTMRAPIIHTPMIHVPISTPRIWGVPAGGALGTASLRHPWRPIRPFPPVVVIYESPFLFGGPFWGWNSCWWASCDLFWPGAIEYTTVYSSGPTNYVSQVNETPVYVYGEERPDLPQLVLKDGTILNVTDYWLVDDQLHFTMYQENGAKPAEHVIPFDALDLQTTVDANTQRGFRFMLRNEPFEQYLRDHPEGPPAVLTPPRE
jgi:hypothetical protein